MRTSELDFDLPADRIAVDAAEPRDSARLMVVHRHGEEVEHRSVRELPGVLASAGLGDGDVMVFNHTRVLPARFAGTRAATGGRVEGLYLESPVVPNFRGWDLMLESRGSPQVGEVIELGHDSRLRLAERLGSGRWRAALEGPHDTLELLSRIGTPPLPPYIRKQRRAQHRPDTTALDTQRYNTVFADAPGSVAAPTAGLHFTPALLSQLDAMGIRRASLTLHIGLGTFAPVRTENLEDHPIHAEWLTIPTATLALLRDARGRGRRIVPVGTTCVRALESLPADLPDSDFTTHTRLFIRPAQSPGGSGGSGGSGDSGGSGGSDGPAPPFAFRFTDALMTNFHLPRSTLLAMVAALPGVGLPRLKGWYRTAIEHGYRFYSYGDAMIIL